jgi:hypothetical protein
MTSLVLMLLLQTAPAQTPPAPKPASLPAAATTPAPPPAAEPEPSSADTLAGLQETYRQTCGQTGILYYSYAELCDTLRRQINDYLDKLDREARQSGKPAAPKP